MMRLVALCAALSACAYQHPRGYLAGGLAMAVVGVAAMNVHQQTACDGTSCIGAGLGDDLVNATAQAAGVNFLIHGLVAVGAGLVGLGHEPHKM